MKRTVWFSFILLLCLPAFISGCRAKNTVDAMKPNVTISFTYARNLKYPPTYVVWVEDKSGNKATLYVTGKAGKNDWGGAKRPSALPVWSGIREVDIDGVSSATPPDKAFIQCNLPKFFYGKKLNLFIEANASFDYNNYYREGLSKGQEGYNDVNGQPSVLWRAELDPSSVRGEASSVIFGVGEAAGTDDYVHKDISHITTAKELLNNIIIKYDFINNKI